MTKPLMGLMQDDFPLNLHHIRRRMRDVHPDAEVVTLTAPGKVQRASFGEVAERVDRLARVLGKLGVEPGDRVGTFAWNNQRHFELYMAVPCVGAVLHTLNIRLFEEQLTYIVNHADDKVIFVDDSLVPLLEKLAPSFQNVRHYVVMGHSAEASEDAGSPPTTLPNALHYEELLAEEDVDPAHPAFDYPEVDERQAAALCYTSGTTGNPKGVLYSHRSICLHSTATLMKDALGLSNVDRVLAVVPMFHANAWGLPHGAALAGADLILPDRFLQAEPLAQLIAAERPTLMGCVPTIFADMLRYADEHPEVDLSSLVNAACGGSAVPKQLMKDFEERHGVRIFQAWGMTETSPVATYSRPDESGDHGRGVLGRTRQAGQAAAVGGVEADRRRRAGGRLGRRVHRRDRGARAVGRGAVLPGRRSRKFDAGWLRTGDIAAVDREGSVQITDRSKDVIKSGGEWISSVELENEVMAHPDVVEAAVIAKPDERWAERPLCCVVLREGANTSADELVEHLSGRVAKWWLPDEFAFIGEVPKTSVGKFDKKVLRGELAEGTLEGRVRV